jgi:hypothetical protein
MVSEHYWALDGGSMQAYEGVASAMLWNAKSGLPHDDRGRQEWGNSMGYLMRVGDAKIGVIPCGLSTVTLVPKRSACSNLHRLGMETCYGTYSNGSYFMNGLNFKVIW